MTFKLITIIVMSFFYVMMGLKHIFDPKYFLPMLPQILPYKKVIIYVSGVLEIILGLCLLIEDIRLYAGIGLMILLVLIFPANIYVAISNEARRKLKVSKSFCVIRLFFQIPLIYLAYWHSL